MIRLLCITPVLLTVFGFGSDCRPCTTFVLCDQSTVIYGRNFDFFFGDGLVIVNQRGIAKRAFVLPGETPATWVSKHGSVTFNQFGREMPGGGMNEAGLVIASLVELNVKYPGPDDRAAITALQWIQFQLDNCSSVDDVVNTDKDIRIVPLTGVSFRPHYLVCDSSGDVATIEFLEGKMVFHRGESLPEKVLTNDTYLDSLAFLRKGDGAGGEEKNGSLNRFSQTAARVRTFHANSPTADKEYAFGILERVSNQRTMWSIVYDITSRQVFYQTRQNGNRRYLSLADCDFAPETQPAYVDVNAPGQGDAAAHLRVLSDAVHTEYLLGLSGRSDVKEKMGDLTPIAKKVLSLLRTYQPSK